MLAGVLAVSLLAGCGGGSDSANGAGNIAEITDERIYYVSRNDGNSSIYSMKTDGSDKQKISDVLFPIYIHIFDDKIYYVSDDSLYSIELSGKDKQKMSEDKIIFPNIVDDKIFYMDEEGNYYVMKLDGTGKNKLE